MDLGIDNSMLRGAVGMTRAKRRRGKRKRRPLFWCKSIIGLVLALVAGWFLLGLAGGRVETPALATGPLTGQIVLIDPGHGGINPGACGLIFFEKDIVLDVGLLLGQKLERAGANVVYTRTGDDIEPNEESGTSTYRRSLIEDSKATIVVSIHCNDFEDPRIKGAQVFYKSSTNELSGRLAELIQKELEASTGTSREVSDEIDHFMLEGTQVPAVTVELGFLSNPDEEKLLGSPGYQETLADCICNAVILFSKGEY